ncbi:MAG: HD domain-containing protein [Olleya sp.]
MFKDYKKLYTHIVSILEDNLPNYLTYHNAKHTLHTLEKTIHIAHKEGVGKNDIQLLKIAALLHDSGYIKTNIEHEEESCKIAKSILADYNISNSEIIVICGMIRATKIPQSPKTHLEMILADADLEYLATTNFKPFGDKLFEELKHYNPKLTRKEWDNLQIKFLENHSYHTSYCKRYKEFRKQKNLQLLIVNK